MRFDTLFNEYFYKRKTESKLGLKGVDKAVQEMSKTNFWLLSFLYAFLIIFLITNVLEMVTRAVNPWFFVVIFLILIALAIALGIVNGRAKKELEYYKTQSRVYSKKRIELMTELLAEYGIEANNYEKIKLLMDEAKKNKRKYDYFAQFKKPKKVVYTLLLPCAAYLGKFYAEHKSDALGFDQFIDENKDPITIFLLLLILVFVFSFAIMPSLDSVIKSKYYYHDDFIEDLRQIIVFNGCEYANKQNDNEERDSEPIKEPKAKKQRKNKVVR